MRIFRSSIKHLKYALGLSIALSAGAAGSVQAEIPFFVKHGATNKYMHPQGGEEPQVNTGMVLYSEENWNAVLFFRPVDQDWGRLYFDNFMCLVPYGGKSVPDWGTQVVSSWDCDDNASLWEMNGERGLLKHRGGRWLTIQNDDPNPWDGAKLVLNDGIPAGSTTPFLKFVNSGSALSSNQLYGRSAPAPVALADVIVGGSWVQKCVSDGDCSMTSEKEYTFSSEFTDSYSNEMQTKVEGTVSASTTVSAGYEGGGGSASASATLSASLTTGLSNAVNTARSNTDRSSKSLKSIFNCNPPRIPIGKLGYFWVSTVKIGANTAEVIHCLDACADSSIGVPTWAPGTNITSCNYTPEEDAARLTEYSCQELSDQYGIWQSNGGYGLAPKVVREDYEKRGCWTQPAESVRPKLCQELSNLYGIRHEVSWGTSEGVEGNPGGSYYWMGCTTNPE